MKKILIVSLLLLVNLVWSQIPTIEWQKSYGGSEFDNVESIRQTADNGFILAGSTDSDDGDVNFNSGDSDFWVVKLDASGSLTWQKTLGGSGSEGAVSIQQTTDGGYIVAGGSQSADGDITANNGSIDFWVVKLNASGDITWEKSLGGSGLDYAYSIEQTSDGGYIVAGKSKSTDGDITANNGSTDLWVVKLNASGDMIWERSLGGSGVEVAHSIQQTSDAGYIVAGFSDSNDGDVTGNNGLRDYWIVKLDASGNIVWEKSLGGTDEEYAYSVAQTTDGGYIVSGNSLSNDGDLTENNGIYDAWILKLDASGNVTWKNSLGGSGWEMAMSVKQTTDGKYIVAGSANSNDGDVIGNNGTKSFWVLMLDATGNLIWQKSLGGSEVDQANTVEQTADQSFIVGGWSFSYDGDLTENNGNGDIWIVKLKPETSALPTLTGEQFNGYPNPATNTFTISSENLINAAFKVIDAQGKQVLSGKMNGKKKKVDISSLTKGVYSFVFKDSALPILSLIKE